MPTRKRRQTSVLFVPDDGSRTVVLKLGYWQLRVAAGALLLVLVMLAVEFAFIWKIQEWRQTARTLTGENRRLHAEVARVEELALALKRIQGTDQKLRNMLLPDSGSAPAPYPNTGPAALTEGNGKESVPAFGSESQNRLNSQKPGTKETRSSGH